MEKNNKHYNVIANIVKENKKYPGLEAILDEIIDDVYSHSEVILNTVTNESVVNAYLEKVVSTSIITVPKKLGYHPNTMSRESNNNSLNRDIDKTLIDKMINGVDSNSNENTKISNDKLIEPPLSESAESSYISEDEPENISDLSLSDDDIAIDLSDTQEVSNDKEDESTNTETTSSDNDELIFTETTDIASDFVDTTEDKSYNIQENTDDTIEGNSDLIDLESFTTEDTSEVFEIEHNQQEESENIEEYHSDNIIDLGQCNDNENTATEEVVTEEEFADNDDVIDLSQCNNNENSETEEVITEEEIADSDDMIDLNNYTDLDDNNNLEPDIEISDTTDTIINHEKDIIEQTAEVSLPEEERSTEDTSSINDVRVESEEGSDNDSVTTSLPAPIIEEPNEIKESDNEQEMFLTTEDDNEVLDGDLSLGDDLDIDFNEEVSLDDDLDNLDQNLLEEAPNDVLEIENVTDELLDDNTVTNEANTNTNTNTNANSDNSFVPIDYSKFNYTPDTDSIIDNIDANSIAKDIYELANRNPNLDIIQIYNLKYKEKETIPKIATELQISEAQVIEALNEIIAVI